MGESYNVQVLDNFHLYDDEEEEVFYPGFPSFETAREFARRRTRSSLEEQRQPGLSEEGLKAMWYQFGESAIAAGEGPEENYYGSSEIDYFIDHPATDEECDWAGMAERLGIRVQSRTRDR